MIIIDRGILKKEDLQLSDWQSYNPRWASEAPNVATVAAIEAPLPLIPGLAERIP